MSVIENRNYVAATACASIILASHIQVNTAASEWWGRLPSAARKGPLADSNRAERADKMGRVIEAKRAATKAVLDGAEPDQTTVKALTADWSTDERIRMLVDLAVRRSVRSLHTEVRAGRPRGGREGCCLGHRRASGRG